MNQRPASRFQKKPRSRYGFLVFCFVSLLAAFTVLRLVLLLKFAAPGAAPWNVLLAFAAGFYRDVIAALWFMLPPLFWCFIIGNRLFASLIHRLGFRLFMTLLWAVQVFLLAAEFYFFAGIQIALQSGRRGLSRFIRARCSSTSGTPIPSRRSLPAACSSARRGCGWPGACSKRCGPNRSGLERGFSGSRAR